MRYGPAIMQECACNVWVYDFFQFCQSSIAAPAAAARYRGGSGFLNSECTSCQCSHMHTRTRAPRALAMQLLGRAVTARTFCAKSAAAHFKMSPLSRANWQHFFSG
jgi:hypothetical protein